MRRRFIRIYEIGNRMKTTESGHSAVFILLPIAPVRIHKNIVTRRLHGLNRVTFRGEPIAQQPVAQLPWGHVLQIIQRIKDTSTRDFYIREAIAHGLSRSSLETQIQAHLHLRQGKALTNFALTMRALPSWAGVCIWRSAVMTSTSIFCSTICVCAAMWSSY
jgi:hypothetical protein